MRQVTCCHNIHDMIFMSVSAVQCEGGRRDHGQQLGTSNWTATWPSAYTPGERGEQASAQANPFRVGDMQLYSSTT